LTELEIRPADIILVRGTGFTDHLIERVTHSAYSHATGLVKTNELLEAQALRRTGYQGIDAYQGCSDVFTCDQLSDAQRQRIINHVSAHIGEQYGYALIPWEGVHYLLHVDIPIDEHVNNDCSTLWASAYRAEGFDPCPDIEYPTPGDLGNSALFRKVGSF